MPITSISRDWGPSPSMVRITTTDSLSTVATSNYVLDQEPIISVLNKGTWEWVVGDLVAVSASDGDNIFKFNGNDFSTFLPLVSSSGIILPTTANHIATYADTAGTLTEDAATAINKGNIQAGLPDGSAGSLVSYGPIPGTGSLSLSAFANNGDFQTVILNSSMNQTSLIFIPDPGNFFGNLLIGAFGGFVTGNILQCANTSGLMVDSGISAASISALVSPIGKTIYVDMDLTFTDLGSGPVAIIPSTLGSETYRIRNIIVNLSAGLSGGDRDIQFSSNGNIYTTITSALALTPINTVWGGTGLNLSSTIPLNQDTVPGSGLFAIYSGGTTDYTGGAVNVTVVYEQTA